MRKNLGTILKFILFLGFGVFLLWLITKGLTDEDKADISRSFREANYLWLLFSICLGFLSHISRAERWRMLMRPLGYEPRFKSTFGAVMVGYLANLAFPRLGEVTKCGIINKYEGIPVDKVVGTMIVERTIDLLCLVLATLLTLFLQFDLIRGFFNEKVMIPLASKFAMDVMTYVILFGGFLVVLGLLYLLSKKMKGTVIYQKIRNLMQNVIEGLISIKDVKNLPLFIFHSLFIWVMYFCMIYVCFFSMKETSELGVPAGLSILIFGTLGIMATPGGIGAYQAIVTETLSEIYLLEQTTAYAFSWIVWVAQTVMILLVGTISLLTLPLIKPILPKNKEADEITGKADS